MESKECKAVIGVLQELCSTCFETTDVLSGAVEEARCAKSLLGNPGSKQERARLVKLGLDIMHFPGFVPSIFLNELFYHKLLGVSLVGLGLIQEKRSSMHAVDVYENFQGTTHKLRKMLDEIV